MHLYVAGPMSSVADWNYPAFHAAEAALRAAGHTVLNPARTEGREHCSSWLDYMRAGVRDIADADGLALLPGWGESRGARVEVDLARGLGLPVALVEEWLAAQEAAPRPA